MTDTTPHSGHETSLPAKKTLRVSFDVDPDFLHEAQEVLSGAAKRLEHVATFMELLRDMSLSNEYDAEDPRLIAAFEIGIAAARGIEAREGHLCQRLFALMDDAKNIGRA